MCCDTDLEASVSCAIKWNLYKHTLGEDATPDNRILERAMVRANAKPDVGQVVKVTKNGELFYVLLFSVCFICILLATSNFFCLPFKLLVVETAST